MAGELYDRRAIVTLKAGAGSSSLLEVASFADASGNGGLRVAFEITKTIQSDANSARVDLYNLAPATRDKLTEKYGVLSVEAGYLGLLEGVFDGEITHAESVRAGSDFITSIECGDGSETFKAQTVEQRFRAGTRVQDVIKRVAGAFTKPVADVENSPVRFGKAPKATKPSRIAFRSLDADLNALDADLGAQGFSLVLRRAFSVSGNAKEAMDKLARMWRFDWSVQDGALQIVSFGRSLVGESVLLSPETGLIGSATKTETGMRCVALLIPQLRPGVLVTVKSQGVEGQFRAETVKLTGDSQGDTWSAEVEARSLALL